MILVVGDVMVDEYVVGSVTRVSQEAPVPILDRTGHYYSPGGAANVALSLRRLGHEIRLVGVVGADVPGHWLRSQFGDIGLITSNVRPTTLKTRYVSADGQQLLRVDVESRAEYPWDDFALKQLELLLKAERPKCVVISDYDKGVINGRTYYDPMPVIMKTCGELGIPVIVDPKKRGWSGYCNATVITPNSAEIALTGETPRHLCELTGATIVETLGAAGAKIHRFRGEFESFVVPVREVGVASTIGAGDVVVAVLAHELAEHGRVDEIGVRRAMEAAARAVTRRGTCVAEKEDL